MPDLPPLPSESQTAQQFVFPDPNATPLSPSADVTVLPDLSAPPTPLVVQSGHWWEYAISKLLYDESGYAVQTIQGGPDDANDVTRPLSPSGTMIIRWISKRRGAAPVVPSRDLQDPNAIYIKGWRSAVVPGRLLNGSACWVVEGQYHYALRKPYKESDIVTLGRMPYENIAANDNQLTPEMYDKTLIGPNLPPANAPSDFLMF